MTHEEFIKWLDNEIQLANKFIKAQEKEPERQYWVGASDAMDVIKQKFLTLTPPPITNK